MKSGVRCGAYKESLFLLSRILAGTEDFAESATDLL